MLIKKIYKIDFHFPFVAMDFMGEYGKVCLSQFYDQTST